METSMGQPISAPHRRTPGGVRSAGRRRVPSRGGASTEGGGVVYSRHHRSRRKQAIKDRRGKWIRIPLPGPIVATIGTGRPPEDEAQKTTVRCRWREFAAGCVQKAWQLER